MFIWQSNNLNVLSIHSSLKKQALLVNIDWYIHILIWFDLELYYVLFSVIKPYIF
jgi:hypothetical protein